MFNVLVDTSVWLDLAQDPRQAPLLLVIERMMREGQLKLIVPNIVLDEFRKNRRRVSEASVKSANSHIRAVREAVRKVHGESDAAKELLVKLDDVGHKVPLVGGAAEAMLDRIEQLLVSAGPLEATQAILLDAGMRALHRKAPCQYENKNGFADAVILETFFAQVGAAHKGRNRFAFVTHNKSDFSAPGSNQRTPHPDISPGFTKLKSLYFIALSECLRRVDPEVVDDVIFEETWEQEPRGLSELLAAERRLHDMVWYNRHWNLRIRIERGEVKLVDEQNLDLHASMRGEVCSRGVWAMALAAAERVEGKLDEKDLGPWDDFEWGMISGKLSAIRWVLGDDWDMLDT